MTRCYFFPEDIVALEKVRTQLYQQIKELGKEQGEVAKQSTEVFGHDDACQEAVYEARRLVVSRLDKLTGTINNAVIVNPEGSTDSVRMGATVELSDERIFRIGSFIVAADHPVTNISYNSPLARAMMHKREGEEVEFNGKIFFIRRIT